MPAASFIVLFCFAGTYLVILNPCAFDTSGILLGCYAVVLVHGLTRAREDIFPNLHNSVLRYANLK